MFLYSSKQFLPFNFFRKSIVIHFRFKRSQNISIKTLKAQLGQFATKFLTMKNKYYNYRSLNGESNSQIKILQEKCFDLETKYSEKCEHLNNLEREIYLTRVCILKSNLLFL